MAYSLLNINICLNPFKIPIQVRAWLAKVFAGTDTPQYEINERTIDILHGLMQRNQERDRETQIIIEDFNQKAEEYHAEGKDYYKFFVQ